MVCATAVSTASADAIFLTGHDPDYHAYLGPNWNGGRNIINTGIGYITDPARNKFSALDYFLFVQGQPPAPADPTDFVDGTLGLAASGYTSADYYLADTNAKLLAELPKLGTTYSALVIGSDFGGSLTQSQLDILNTHSADIISFLQAGGGLFAMAESNSYVVGHYYQDGTLETGLTTGGGWYGYLPFIQTIPCGQYESGVTLTPFGASLGLTTNDVNGNYAHNCFVPGHNLTAIDIDSQGRILSVAGTGIVPEPASLILLATGLLGAGGARWRKFRR